MINSSSLRSVVAVVAVFSAFVDCRADWIGETTVYLEAEQAKKVIFNGSQELKEQELILTSEQVQAIEKKLQDKLGQTKFIVSLGETDGKIDGYAMVVEEIGKFRPITFVVGVRPDGKVSKVAIMVYRESRGSEVRHPRFLRQFQDKKSRDAIRINRDIISISGATLSVIAVTKGVRKVLTILEETYLKEPAVSAAPTISAGTPN